MTVKLWSKLSPLDPFDCLRRLFVGPVNSLKKKKKKKKKKQEEEEEEEMRRRVKREKRGSGHVSD